MGRPLEWFGKSTLDAVLRLQRAVIQLGRKKGISSCTTSHKPATGKESSHILTGMTHLVCWPHHGASKNMRRVLEVYAGQPPEILSLFRKDPAWGRCVTLRLTTPAVAIGARRAILLNRPEVIDGIVQGRTVALGQERPRPNRE